VSALSVSAKAANRASGVPWLAMAGWLALFAALAGAPAVLDQYFVEIGFKFLVFCVLAEAWNLMAGYCGLVSLGVSSFFGLGGYVAVGLLNNTGLALAPALAVAALWAAGMAAIVSRALFRLRGLYFTVGTLALSATRRMRQPCCAMRRSPLRSPRS